MNKKEKLWNDFEGLKYLYISYMHKWHEYKHDGNHSSEYKKDRKEMKEIAIRLDELKGQYK